MEVERTMMKSNFLYTTFYLAINIYDFCREAKARILNDTDLATKEETIKLTRQLLLSGEFFA